MSKVLLQKITIKAVAGHLKKYLGMLPKYPIRSHMQFGAGMGRGPIYDHLENQSKNTSS